MCHHPARETVVPEKMPDLQRRKIKACNNSFNFNLLLDNLINTKKLPVDRGPIFLPFCTKVLIHPQVENARVEAPRWFQDLLCWDGPKHLTSLDASQQRGLWWPGERSTERPPCGRSEGGLQCEEGNIDGDLDEGRLFVFFVSQDVLVLLLDVWDRKMDLCRMLHKFCCKAVKTTYSKVFLGW